MISIERRTRKTGPLGYFFFVFVKEMLFLCITFLDTKTIRNEDGSITIEVYRKGTHTDKYLNYNSHHPNQHKRSAAKTLFACARTIPSTEKSKLSETKYVEDVLRINNYPRQFVKSCLRPSRSSNTSGQKEETGLVVLPYNPRHLRKDCKKFKCKERKH